MIFLPIVERELRVAARQPSTLLVRFLVALIGVILWLGLLGSAHRSTTPAEVGEILFVLLSMLLFAWCLFAGVFLTADCLSHEKREGTMGLLFLTDLKGYDIVFGKLASTSVRSAYAVLAALPVLALPLLLGGVTAAAFWRVVMALLVTLYLSLACGLFMSAISRQSRSAIGGTFLWLFFVTAVLPLSCYAIFEPPLPGWCEKLLLWPSPAVLLTSVWSPLAGVAHGAFFWPSFAISAAAGTAFLGLACVTLPLSWRERAHAAPKRRSSSQLRLGDRANPYFWFASRGQPRRSLVCGLVLAAAAISVGFLLETHRAIADGGRAGWTFAIGVLTAFAAHQLFKYMVTAEASRCFSEDRRNGMMELLMISPLSPAAILNGQRRALAALFRIPTWILVGLNMLLIFSFTLTRPYGPQFETWTLVLAGGMVLLVADYYALTWTGMWLGLRNRRHYRAVTGTLLRVIMPPWAVALFLLAGLGRGRLSFEEILICWMFLGGAISLVLGQYAQMQLREHFRAIAQSDSAAAFLDRIRPGSRLASPILRAKALRRDTA